MKISTTLSFQRSLNSMQEGQAEVAKTREQLATGKAVVRPSDDTMKVSSIDNLDRAIAKEDTYDMLMGQLKDRYQLEEASLTNGSDILIRIRELAVQGANATLSAKDREIIAVEVQGLRDELLSIANTRDENGNSIFAGGNTELTAFKTQTDGSVLYQGDARQTYVNVSDERQLGKNRNGLDVFTSADRNVPGSPASFTISVADLSKFNTAQTLSDGVTRIVLDHSGANAPQDAQDLLTDITGHASYSSFAYTATLSGNDLVFTAKTNGRVATAAEPTLGTMTVNQGSAGVADSVQGVSFFASLDDFISSLQQDNTANIQRALGEITQLHDGLALAIGKVGSEIQSVDTQMEINTDTRLRLQSMLSSEEDLDYAEAITRFNQEMTRLEATQTSFAQVSRLSLFEYL
ncbi:MAG: flagellar hook-associated protein 3 [Gammaproteobacteria bacterium]|nr:flagellar hook-associated protein 3 [Gammaproteobacteria bacterium]